MSTVDVLEIPIQMGLTELASSALAPLPSNKDHNRGRRPGIRDRELSDHIRRIGKAAEDGGWFMQVPGRMERPCGPIRYSI